MSEFRDIYSKVTNRIVADLEQGVRPWMRPWSVEHAAGKITRPLRHNGIPYKGINVVMLWSASVTVARQSGWLRATIRMGTCDTA
jgi:antirestriction protein ArdC